jgi:hypothetical protein
MSFLKGWKMKQPGQQPNPLATASSPIAAFNAMPDTPTATPEQNIVARVKPADNQMSKFNGLKRRLAHYRNGFKDSTDKNGV